MDNQKMLSRVAVAIAVLGILFVVVRHQSQAAQNADWAELASARAAGFTVEALENARDATRGSDVEPWCAYYLATELYDSGEGLDRAEQVARETLDSYGDHATAPMLRKLLSAVTSYRVGS